MNFALEHIRRSRTLFFAIILFVSLSVWWLLMYLNGITEGVGITLFLLAYPVITIIGGIYGLSASKKWGGFRSMFGSSILYFSLGLIAQTFGQYLYSYYQIYLGIEAPYPSIGDLFYFASVILYIIGSFKLAQVAGFKLTLHTIKGKMIAFIIPTIVLSVMYYFLVKGYEPDWSNFLVVFLDYGWLLGQAIYLSISILALLISRDILGGMMRRPIMIVILALMTQFFADFYFSYQVSREVITYYPAGVTDYFYFFGYFLMTIALIIIGNMFYKVQES